MSEGDGRVYWVPIHVEEVHHLDPTHVALVLSDGEVAVVESMGTVTADGLTWSPAQHGPDEHDPDCTCPTCLE